MNEVVKDQYWLQFKVAPADLERLANFLVETESPKTIEQLTQELVRYRYQQLLTLAEETLAQGRIYRPGETYQVGEQVLFPNSGNRLGEVVEVRPGHNPEYEPFTVLTIAFEGGKSQQFAASLPVEHPLDRATYLPSGEATPEELYALHGERVSTALAAALRESPQFISMGPQWFLKELVVEISAGQLNIAEALLDMAGGGPLPTQALLDELELPGEIAGRLQLFSLECALQQDARFDEVGPAGEAQWYLMRMEPQAVLQIPEHLRYMPIPYNRSLLDEGMLALEAQVDDEWAETTFGAQLDEDMVTLKLIYPHWRSGTLPLAARFAQLFPTARLTNRVRFSFVDGRTGKTFPGWVVRNHRYVYGLEAWYDELGVTVGTFVDLKAGEHPDQVTVDVRRVRSRRSEWVRTATVQDGRIYFEVKPMPMACKYDELSVVVVPDPAEIDELASELRHEPLEKLIEQVFSGLAALSLQRAVHGATLYSAVNLLRRVPPAPLVATLLGNPRYEALGDNYWAYRGGD